MYVWFVCLSSSVSLSVCLFSCLTAPLECLGSVCLGSVCLFSCLTVPLECLGSVCLLSWVSVSVVLGQCVCCLGSVCLGSVCLFSCLTVPLECLGSVCLFSCLTVPLECLGNHILSVSFVLSSLNFPSPSSLATPHPQWNAKTERQVTPSIATRNVHHPLVAGGSHMGHLFPYCAPTSLVPYINCYTS